jgi:uncharacterized damage-inducible protein DinB
MMKPSQMFTHWDQVRTDLVATIDKFTQEELTFVPFKGSWSVGQIMLHIADCENYWLHFVVRQEIDPWKYYDLADYPSVEAIKKVLDIVRLKTLIYLESLEESDLDKVYQIPEGETYTLGWIIWHVVEHEIHHRGELSLLLGLLGRPGLDV